MDVWVLVSLALGLSVSMSIAWAIQRTSGASGWIDTIWSLAVGLGGIAATIMVEGDTQRRVAVAALVAVWSLRLAGHIGSRTRMAGEDPRYSKLMDDWGSAASRQLFGFLQIQALAAFILVLCIYLAAAKPRPFADIGDVIAITVALIAMGGEVLADMQLARFRKTSEAKTSVCEVGLWRYSRHPNYFFEWLFWCALSVMAINVQSAWSWLAILAPAQMYWLLVHVSGIPPLEAHMLRSRGDAFRSLQRRVNAFFPGPRRAGGE